MKSNFKKPVLQMKLGATSALSRPAPLAPPVYRPQPMPLVLQKKARPGMPSSKPALNSTAQKKPVAPPIYRPERKQVVQPKAVNHKPNGAVVQRAESFFGTFMLGAAVYGLSNFRWPASGGGGEQSTPTPPTPSSPPSLSRGSSSRNVTPPRSGGSLSQSSSPPPLLGRSPSQSSSPPPRSSSPPPLLGRSPSQSSSPPSLSSSPPSLSSSPPSLSSSPPSLSSSPPSLSSSPPSLSPPSSSSGSSSSSSGSAVSWRPELSPAEAIAREYRRKNERYSPALRVDEDSSSGEEEEDDGGGGGNIGGYRRPKAFKKSSGKSAKIHSKGAKGGISCQLDHSGEEVEQGSNSNINQHAERRAVGISLRSRGKVNIGLTQTAWPCMPCHHWLRGCANTEQITVTVTVTDDQGGYAAGHGKAPDSTGVITYHPNGTVTYA